MHRVRAAPGRSARPADRSRSRKRAPRRMLALQYNLARRPYMPDKETPARGSDSEKSTPRKATEETAGESPNDEVLVADGPDDYKALATIVLAVIGTVLMLQFAQPVLIPVVVAVLMGYVLGPAVASMYKHGVPRFLGS